MSDLIDRQAAIDALDEQIAQCNKAIKSFVLSMKDEYAAKVEKASLTAFRERLEYLPPAQPEPCEDAVSRAEILRMINCINDHHAITPYKSVGAVTEHLTRIASSLQPVTPKPIQPEYHEIGYRECADAVLKMWMDNVLTDGEHNRIIDKLNAKWAISEGDA